MSVKKSYKKTLLLGALAALIVGAYIFSTERAAPALLDQPGGQVASEQPTAAEAVVANAAEDSDHPADCAHCLAVSTPAERPIYLTTQPETDHYFKALSGKPAYFPRDTFDAFKGSEKGQQLSIELGPIQLSGTVVAVREHELASKYALDLDDDAGRLVVNTSADGRLGAYIVFNEDSRALLVGVNDALQTEPSLVMKEGTVSDVFCTPPGSVYPLSSPTNTSAHGVVSDAYASVKLPFGAKALPPLEGVAAPPVLDSAPGSEYVMYLDFDGEVVEDDPDWGTILAMPHPRANEEDWVTAVWLRVVEDFAPFNITITTDRSVFDNADPTKRLQVICTPTDDAAPGAGGVAARIGYFGSFSPICWTFNPTEYSCASTISHEAGHVFGLSHDGRLTDDEYYGGHNDDYSPGWAPIMGAPWSDEGAVLNDEVDSWSRGEYTDANNQQDDLAIIGNSANGFGFKADDYSDNFLEGTPEIGIIAVSGDNQISAQGIIESAADVDVLRFSTSSGICNITVSPFDVDSPITETGSNTRGANLAVFARVFDSDFEVVATGINSGRVDLSSNIQVDLPNGIYYLVIEGAGRGADGTVGFTDYGSVGQYVVSGTVAAQPLSVSGGDKVLQPVLEGDTEITLTNGTDFWVKKKDRDNETYFAFTRPNEPVTNIFYLRNNSNFEITNLAINLDVNAEFSVVSSVPTSIPSGVETPISIRYNPSSTGIHSDQVSITYDGERPELFQFAIGGTASSVVDDDNYENGTNASSAENLTNYEDVLLSDYKGLGWMTDYKDWYQFTVDDNDQVIDIQTFYDPSGGEIKISLYRYPNYLVAEGVGTEGEQNIRYLIPQQEGWSRTYYILLEPVEANTSLKNTYDLKWSAYSVSDLGFDDLYELNNSSDAAFDLSNATGSRLSEILGLARQGDDDWYKVTVPRDPFARFLYVSAEFNQTTADDASDDNALLYDGVGDINIELYDESFNLLDAPIDLGNREFISYFEIIGVNSVADDWTPPGNTALTGPPQGTYYVRVSGDNAGNEYDLFFGTISDDLYEVLPNGDENDTFDKPYDLGSDIIDTMLSEINGCGMTGTYAENASIENFVNRNDPDWYRFRINQPNVTRVEVSITGLGVASDYLAYALTDTDGRPLDVLTTSAEQPATGTYVLTIDNPQDLEYLIRVESFQDIGILTPYDFSVRLIQGNGLLPGAVEDNYEQNNAFNQAFNISQNRELWLTSMRGYGTQLNADWYSIDVPEGATSVEILCFYNDDDGVLNLSLTNENGLVLQTGEDGNNRQVITWDNPSPGTHLIAVTGDNIGVRYNLFWNAIVGEDNYEDNDDLESSYDIVNHERTLISKLDGKGIQKDDDWYKIHALADTFELRVAVAFDHDEGDIDVELYNSDGYIVARAVSTNDNELIEYPSPSPGDYYVRVYYDNSGNEYELAWAAINDAELARVRLAEDDYEQNDTIDNPYELTRLEPRLRNLLGLGTQGDDDWYEIEMPAGNFGLYVECLFDGNDADIDIELYDSLGSTLVRRDSVTSNEILEFNDPLPAGKYTIRVYGPDLGNEYDLYWVPLVDDIFEDNDVRAQAYDVTGQTGSQLSDLGLPTLNDDDWYSVEVTGDYPYIRVTLDYVDLNGRINFAVYDSEPDEIALADDTEDSQTIFAATKAGTNYIKVFGDDEYNIYDLFWEIEQDDQYEENDVPLDAVDITDQVDVAIEAVQFDDDWFKLTVAQANSFVAALVEFEEGAGIDLEIYSSNDLNTPLTLENRGEGLEYVSFTADTPAGEYFVRVFGSDGDGLNDIDGKEAYTLRWVLRPDDIYDDGDGNDLSEDATDFTGQEEVLIEDLIQFDEDWYEVIIMPGEVSLSVELQFLHSNGDVNFAIYDDNGNELAVAESDTDNEYLLYGPNPFTDPLGDSYYIKVYGQNIGTPYSLVWEASTDDVYDRAGNNNTFPSRSTGILDDEGYRISQRDGYGTSEAQDWYEVEINAGDDGIVIEACFVHDVDENIDIELFRADDQRRVAGSYNVGDLERIHYRGPSGTYVICVFGDLAGNAYDLQWNSYREDDLEVGIEFGNEIRGIPNNDNPTDPRRLLETRYNANFYPNVEPRGIPNLELFLLEGLTLLDEDWYSVSVDAGEDIFIVDVQFEHLQGDIDVAVYHRDTETLLEQAVTETDNERIVLRDLAPGDYLICVYGYGIKNPKQDEDLGVWTFDPYTQNLRDVPYFVFEDEIAENNARALGNTYSLRWNSTTEDIYDIETPDDDTDDPEVNDDRDNVAIPPLVDQFGAADLDGVIDDDIRTNIFGQDYQSEFVYQLVQFDEDWFEFQVDTTNPDDSGSVHQLYVSVSFEHVQGDLGLRLYDAISGELLDESFTEEDIEYIDYFSQTARTYHVQVVGEDVGTPYALTIRAFDDDIYEDNDDFIQVTDIREFINQPIFGIQRDDDYYLVEVPKDQVHLFAFLDDQADALDFVSAPQVFDASQEGLPSEYYLSRVVSPDASLYYILVSGDNIGASYYLQWRFDNEDEYEGFGGNDAPEDAPLLTPRRLEPTYNPQATYLDPWKELRFDYDLYDNRYAYFGHATQEGDDWYQLQIPDWKVVNMKIAGTNNTVSDLKREFFVQLQVELDFLHEDGDINVEIYDELDLDNPIARAESTTDGESLFAPIDIEDEDVDRVYYVRVYGDNAANSYEMAWDVTTDDAYETNNFVEQAFDLTNIDGASTEGEWLDFLEFPVDVDGDGDASNDGFMARKGFGSQTTDDWYAVVVSGDDVTELYVECRFWSDDNAYFDYAPDNLDVDVDVYFLAGNDGDPATVDQRKPVLVRRIGTITAPFGSTTARISEDITEWRFEAETFPIDAYGPGIYFIRVYFDNRAHPYTLTWFDDGADNTGDADIYTEYRDGYLNGEWSFVPADELPSDLLNAPFDNDDGDRLPNWAEYALGLNANIADYAIVGQSIVEIGEDRYYQYEFLRNKEAEARGYVFTVEETDNMVFDGTEAVFMRTESVNIDVERVFYRCSKPIDEQDRCFFRLTVKEPAPKE